jgi:hypothetical protein
MATNGDGRFGQAHPSGVVLSAKADHASHSSFATFVNSVKSPSRPGVEQPGQGTLNGAFLKGKTLRLAFISVD